MLIYRQMLTTSSYYQLSISIVTYHVFINEVTHIVGSRERAGEPAHHVATTEDSLPQVRVYHNLLLLLLIRLLL